MRGAKLLIVGFEGLELTAEERRILRRLQPGGLILFQRNIASAEQLHALVAELRALCGDALFYVDSEGGRVDRLREVAGRAPSGAALARARPAAAERAGHWVGQALRHFGFDVDLAPVVDLDRGEKNNALDGRYLGATPRAVAARGAAFLRGLHSADVAGCLKHFPGLGAARMDTHLQGAPIELSTGELERDLAPFAALCGQARMVMASHASYPALDPEGRPATLSQAISTVVLRRRLGFRGVLVSDDLEMGALGVWGDLPQRTAAALAAGCDLLPVCRHLAACPEVAAALGKPALRERREEAMSRVERFRRHRRALGTSYDPLRAPTLEEIRRRLAALTARLGEPSGPRPTS